jgi:hypothetical protein
MRKYKDHEGGKLRTKPKILLVGFLPLAAGGMTSPLLTILLMADGGFADA